MKIYTVTSFEGELIFKASLVPMSLILQLHPLSIGRIIRECDEEGKVCVLQGKSKFFGKYQEVYVHSKAPWLRLLSENQRSDLVQEQGEDIRDDPFGYAEGVLDEMTEIEVRKWMAENTDYE